MIRNITFNSLDLQDDNIITATADHEIADKTFNIARVNKRGSKVIDEKVATKKIILNGTIQDTSQANLDAKLDTIKQTIMQEDTLAIDYGSGTRSYKAVGIGFDVERNNFNTNVIKYQAVFKTLMSGYDATIVTDNHTGLTADLSSSITITGTAKPYPVLTLTNSGTLSEVEITNTTTSRLIKVTTSLVATDVLKVDLYNLAVTKNGTAVDYVGVIPEWDLGSNSYTVDVTGTSISYEFKLEYYKRYL